MLPHDCIVWLGRLAYVEFTMRYNRAVARNKGNFRFDFENEEKK